MDKTNLSKQYTSYLRGVNQKQDLKPSLRKNLAKANSEGALNPKFKPLVAQGQRELQLNSLKGR